MEFGESFEETCYRETLKRRGLKSIKNKLKLISVTNNIIPDAHFVTLGFSCEGFSGEAKVMEPDEITEWKWFALDDLPPKVFPPSQEIIEHYRDKKIY